MGLGHLMSTICKIKVANMLVDGGAGYILSPAIFEKIQLPLGRLQPTKLFSDVTPRITMPIGQMSLMVTSGTRDNYRTKSVIFDVAELELPYNGIMGRPALTKLMAAPYYAYLTVKMPGPQGPITVPADLQSSVRCAQKLRLAAVASVCES